ncbi:MAG: 1-acyl-sn-glycerol-3-phosphate acyltransferase [Deltaproteobacteria bacterium CG_4_10_14_3_um_filter_60_8]|nr:MAG: 1-acyl-sn-glycerol-3-phosphate acyltransferase [Desulfobacterales bacterium CG2_30_60_27]PIP42793.1 MAG: 1-acyl-sn-glycerol-3-phosphate acyltransferase [Deltaproteobacteria bacterium CG23_combo_of_CG06-09_8_20_14_all_60_8]PIY22128.1 MAG: 1-acyl-sn-glycerol-3-phosphate acyltransferase [Deltaproteobacteria bacterium CG_4_10_14_3_um_filter_60_8]
MRAVRFLQSIFVLVLAPPLTFLVSILAIVAVAVFRVRPSKVQVFPRFWGRILCRASGVSVTLHGLENLDHDKHYIFAANHQSQFDIFALQGYLAHDCRFLAKQELFRIPFFGTGMRLAGYIPVDRAHGRQALKSLEAAAKRIAAGTSVILFPEGTRSPDGILQPFKAGGMVLAIKAGVPLVPVGITGSFAILPKGRWLARPGRIRIRIGQPIETRDYDLKQKKELADRLHDEVARLLVEEGTKPQRNIEHRTSNVE